MLIPGQHLLSNSKDTVRPLFESGYYLGTVFNQIRTQFHLLNNCIEHGATIWGEFKCIVFNLLMGLCKSIVRSRHLLYSLVLFSCFLVQWNFIYLNPLGP